MENKKANKNNELKLSGLPGHENRTDYGQAVLHLAWFQDGDQVRHLLFGMVELRPCEFPITSGSDEQTLVSDRMSLHYRRFALSVSDAIGWYRRSMDGDVHLPVSPSDNPAGTGGFLLRGGPFAGWPAWPTLAASNKLDFAPDWLQGSRAHFLHPRTKLATRALAAVRCERNRRQLENWLHFDLVHLYSDYLGAICLAAPNPLFRSIEKSHLDSPNDGFAETVAYKLIARTGQDVDGTRLEVVNESLRGRLTPVAAEFADDPVQMLDFVNTIPKEGRIVTHPHYGLLAWNEPVPLVRAIAVGFGVVSRQKIVEVPRGGKKKPAYDYRVPELEDGEDVVIGRIPDDGGMEASAVSAAYRRAKKATERAELWFQDAPQDATQFIRDAIGQARHRVFIADPYFAGRELLAFGHAIQRPDVELRVLTSKLAFRKGTSGTDSNVDPVRDLQLAIETFESYPAKPAIRVLKGNPPRLHDRFLVVDKTVWFSGNSLNSIGERAAMVVRLSHPEAVVPRLDGMWATATPFSNRVTDLPGDA